MSVIYKDSVIRVQQKYTVQEVSKFPQEKKFLRGKNVLVLDITNDEVSVRFGSGTAHYIPLRSLISVPGYEIKGVHAPNADGFVVRQKNQFDIEPGTAFLEPTKVDDEFAYFLIEGKEWKYPLSMFFRLVRKTVKVKDKQVKKEVKQSGVPLTVIEAVAGAIQVEPLEELPSSVLKLLPDLNIPVMIDKVKNKSVEVFDFSGEVHENVIQASLSNEKFIHRLIQETVQEELTKLFNKQFQDIRDQHE